MATATLKTELTKLRKAASERIDCGDVLTVRDMTPDMDYVRQGDIFLFAKSDVPPGYRPVERPTESDWQLAIGTTQGSRHVVSAKCRGTVRLYRPLSSGEFTGPCLECPEGVVVEHPEHGWLDMGPGVYAVGYQQVFAEVARRVAD